jgi:hypothetical protein
MFAFVRACTIISPLPLSLRLLLFASTFSFFYLQQLEASPRSSICHETLLQPHQAHLHCCPFNGARRGGGGQGLDALIDAHAVCPCRVRLQDSHDPRVQRQRRGRRGRGRGAMCGHGRLWCCWCCCWCWCWCWCWWSLGLLLELQRREGRALLGWDDDGFAASRLFHSVAAATAAAAELLPVPQDAEGREDVSVGVVREELAQAGEGKIQSQGVHPPTDIRLEGPRHAHRHADCLQQRGRDAQPLPRHGPRPQRLCLGDPAQDGLLLGGIDGLVARWIG